MLELNKIHFGDCYELIKLIPDKSVDLIVTDPPYQIDNTKAGGKSELSRSIQGMNDELERNELGEGIDFSILDEFVRVMKKINCYIWCNHKQIPDYLDFFVKEQGCSFDILIWNKTNALPLFNNKYLTDKEYCLYFRKGGYCNPSNYEDAKTVFYEPINIKDKQHYRHPTIKPLKVIRALIRNSSREQDVILDPFIGSGTTAVAAQETGRQFIGMELNEKYHKIAVDRVEGFLANGQASMFGSKMLDNYESVFDAVSDSRRVEK